MEKKIYIILTVLALVVLGGCSKALDEAPGGKISLEEVFSDNDKTMYYLNSCYKSLPNKGIHYFFWSRGPVDWSDDAWDADDLDVDWAASRKFYDGNATASAHPVWCVSGEDLQYNYWEMYFARIRNCALFLQQIPTANVTDEADRSRWTAEAHLLRAFYYRELLRWFGCGLPLVDEPFTYSADFSAVKKASYKETVDFILKDCDAALSCPELPWRITSGSENYRVTKALAWAIKSQMINFAASPLYNEGQNYWEEAYKINKAAVAALEDAGYYLYTGNNGEASRATWTSEKSCLDYQTNPDYDIAKLNKIAQYLNEYFCNSCANAQEPIDHETIYQSIDGQWNLSNVDGIGAISGYKTGTCPTQELVDAFETINGKTILNLSKPYKDDQHLQPNFNADNEMYNEQDPYANKDPRFYATIYFNTARRYCPWGSAAGAISFENAGQGKGTMERVITTWCQYVDASGNLVKEREPLMGFSLTGRTPTRTGYFERKFLHPNEGPGTECSTGNHKDFRLAEMYLNLAEAACESNHMDDAHTYINKVRARAGMPALTGLSQNEFRLRLHNEYRVEFALEGNRFFDVRRWHKPDEDLSDTDHWVTAAKITHTGVDANGKHTYKYERQTIKERNCYTNKWLKAAIPLNEVNNMKAITGEDWQNPGW